LATFKDGSGNLRMPDGSYRPDWRQVERAFADVFDGKAAESKAIFDVDVVPSDGRAPYGLSIKTSLRKPDGRVLLELNNSPAKMLAFALESGLAIDVGGGRGQWDCSVEEMGHSVINAVKSWHEACASTHDLDGSCYVVMTHDRKKEQYQILQFELDIGEPADLDWSERGKAIIGYEPDSAVVRWEYYAGSGGQLKWYPDSADAVWTSELFGLPDPSKTVSLSDKAREMFSEDWPS
jgi:hypothetical protein